MISQKLKTIFYISIPVSLLTAWRNFLTTFTTLIGVPN